MIVVIGIDPDIDAHGVAVYRGGVLDELLALTTPFLADYVRSEPGCIVSIENVMANRFIYSRNLHSSPAAQSTIAMRIGRNQQSQVELMRLLDYYGESYELHKPAAGNWANNKALFERLTGWAKRSSEDTRSAAYFGYLALPGRKIARPATTTKKTTKPAGDK